MFSPSISHARLEATSPIPSTMKGNTAPTRMRGGILRMTALMISFVPTRRASTEDNYATNEKGRIAPAFRCCVGLCPPAPLQSDGRTDTLSLSRVTALQNAGPLAWIAEQNAGLLASIAEQNAGLLAWIAEQNAWLLAWIAEQNAGPLASTAAEKAARSLPPPNSCSYKRCVI